MRAWQIYNYGDLRDLRLSDSYRVPVITSPSQVLVRIEAASINPIDLSIINGYGASAFKIIQQLQNINEFPRTLGRDFCGTVEKVGRSVGVFRPGMKVIGALWPYEEGCHADYALCGQHQLALKPRDISVADAAALPYAGLTAFSGLVDFGGLTAGNAAGKRLLILGSSGGVGTIALQLGKAWGAFVAVTCREDSEDLMMELGADAIHSNELTPANETYDIIFDCIGDDFETYAPYLKSRSSSRYITIKQSLLKLSDQYSPLIGLPMAGVEMVGKVLKSFVCNDGKIYQWATFRASGRNLTILSSLVEQGLIIPVVHAQFSFEDASKAYSCLQSGGIKGKVIIQMVPNEVF